jgi:CBS domain-containing protein
MLDEAKIVARDIMTRDVAVVHPETTLLDALKLMASRRVSGLPVVDEHGTLVGMMSEGDVLGWHEGFSEREARWFDLLADGFELAPDFLREVQEQRRKIKAVMSSNPITVIETTVAREIASLMHAHGIKCVPVMRDGELVGIITRADLVSGAGAEARRTRASAAPVDQRRRSIAAGKGGGDSECQPLFDPLKSQRTDREGRPKVAPGSQAGHAEH